MINMFTFDRAVAHAEMIGAHGLVSDIQVMQLDGYIGRVDRPIHFLSHAVTYVQDHKRRFTVWADGEFEDHKAMFVIDGIGYYVAGWQATGGGTFLHAIDRITTTSGGTVPNMLPATRRAFVMWTTDPNF